MVEMKFVENFKKEGRGFIASGTGSYGCAVSYRKWDIGLNGNIIYWSIDSTAIYSESQFSLHYCQRSCNLLQPNVSAM